MTETPLRQMRRKRGESIAQVASATEIDRGNLSRIERGVLRATPAVAERLAQHFGHAVTEMQILYPERYTAPDKVA